MKIPYNCLLLRPKQVLTFESLVRVWFVNLPQTLHSWGHCRWYLKEFRYRISTENFSEGALTSELASRASTLAGQKRIQETASRGHKIEHTDSTLFHTYYRIFIIHGSSQWRSKACIFTPSHVWKTIMKEPKFFSYITQNSTKALFPVLWFKVLTGDIVKETSSRPDPVCWLIYFLCWSGEHRSLTIFCSWKVYFSVTDLTCSKWHGFH